MLLGFLEKKRQIKYGNEGILTQILRKLVFLIQAQKLAIIVIPKISHSFGFKTLENG